MYFDDTFIVAEVVSDKVVKFEGKDYRLSPLTREIEMRKNRLSKSGSYWGADKWKHSGKTLVQLIDECTNYNDDIDEEEDENT